MKKQFENRNYLNKEKIDFPQTITNKLKTCLTFQVAVEINLWRDSSDNKFLKSLPIAEILECIGFVSILLVESMVASHGHGHSHGQVSVPHAAF